MIRPNSEGGCPSGTCTRGEKPHTEGPAQLHGEAGADAGGSPANDRVYDGDGPPSVQREWTGPDARAEELSDGSLNICVAVSLTRNFKIRLKLRRPNTRRWTRILGWRWACSSCGCVLLMSREPERDPDCPACPDSSGPPPSAIEIDHQASDEIRAQLFDELGSPFDDRALGSDEKDAEAIRTPGEVQS